MTKQTLFLSLFSSLLLLAAFKPANTSVRFEAASWEQSKAKAKTQGKLYFVDFDASYCATCRTMDESTYMDERLASYISSNVVAQRVDVQDFDGVMWSQQYEVEALPTMLIFNEQGQLVRRLVGYQSGSDLLRELQQVRNGAARPAVAVVAPNNSKDPQPIAPDQPMLRPGQTRPAVAVVAPSNNPIAERPMVEAREEGLGLYEIAVRRQNSKGFSIQVGVYSNYESVLEQASQLKSKYSKKTMVHVARYKGDVVYKLLVGAFDNKREASYFRNDLRKDNIDGLLKDLSFML